MRRWVWTALFFLALFEVFSVLPLRVDNLPLNSPPFLQGVIHLSVPPSGLTIKARNRLEAAAKKARLDFLVLAATDAKQPEAMSGSRASIDFFSEMEASTPAGHALLFFSHTKAQNLPDKALREMAWRHFLGQESSPGVFLVIAHPSSIFTPWERLDRFPEGIELINLRSLVEHQAFNNPLAFGLTLLVSPINPYLAALRLFDPVVRDLRGWDSMNSVSPGHFGVVATDDLSHWPWLSEYGWVVPAWNQALGVATNIVFPEEALAADFPQRRIQIYRALKEGRGALLFHAIHPFDGNDWMLACGQKEYRSGNRFALREAGCEFVVRTPGTLPYAKRLVLYRDGETVAEVANAKAVERIPAEHDGVYRLEVWVKRTSMFRFLLNREVPYLLYNPLYVR